MQGVVTHAVWDGGYHPKMFKWDDMTDDLIKDLRKSSNAFYHEEIRFKSWPCKAKPSLSDIRSIFQGVLGNASLNASSRVEYPTPRAPPRFGVYCGAPPPPMPEPADGASDPFSPDVQLISEAAGAARRLLTSAAGRGRDARGGGGPLGVGGSARNLLEQVHRLDVIAENGEVLEGAA